MFEGDTGDPATLAEQVRKIRERFGLERVILVGDRGLITQARIEKELKPAGLDWITALRAPQIQQLVQNGNIQLSLFDQQDLGEAVLTHESKTEVVASVFDDLSGGQGLGETAFQVECRILLSPAL